MAQQNIDFGSFPNDPTADPIRAAFQKVQNNFTDLYSQLLSTGVSEVNAGAGLSQNRTTGNVALTANISSITLKTSGFTNSTNSLRVGVVTTPGTTTATITQYNTPFTIDLAPTITTANANFTGSLYTANFSMTGYVNSSLIPGAHQVYDLGTPTRRWKDLYLSGNSLSLGTISVTDPYGNGTLAISSSLVTGNIDAGNIAAGTVSGNLATAAQPNITSVGTLTSLTVATSINAANMTVSGAFSAGTIYGNVVVPPGGNIQAPGSDMQVIFNDSGNQKAVAGMTFNKTTSLLTIQGNISGGNIESGNANFTGNIGVNKVVATGNIEGSNIVTLGVVSTTSGLTTGANLAITGISGTGSPSNVVTVTFATQSTTPFAPSTNITISGVSPSSYNGTWTVVSGNTTQVTFTSSVSATASFAGARIRGNGDSVINGVLTVVGNTSIGNITAVNAITGNIITVSGNVDSGNLISQGILQVTGTANLGAVYSPGDANVLNSLVRGNFTSSGTTAFFAGAVTSNSSMTIAGLLTASNGASVTGNLGAGNISSGGSFYVSTFANVASYMIVGGNFTHNGQWANMAGNANVAGTFFAGGANIANFIVSQAGSVSGNVFTAQMFTGNGANITFINASNVSGIVANASFSANAGNATTALTADRANNISLGSYSNITGVGTLVSLNVTGDFAGSNANIGGYLRMSVNNAIGANGASQSTATVLTKTINVVTSVTGGTGVQLPSALAGQIIYVINDTNTAITVYPASGQYIDAQAQNAGFDVGAYGRMQFIGTSGTKYYSMTSIYA